MINRHKVYTAWRARMWCSAKNCLVSVGMRLLCLADSCRRRADEAEDDAHGDTP